VINKLAKKIEWKNINKIENWVKIWKFFLDEKWVVIAVNVQPVRSMAECPADLLFI
jgi:hypothetical protein